MNRFKRHARFLQMTVKMTKTAGRSAMKLYLVQTPRAKLKPRNAAFFGVEI